MARAIDPPADLPPVTEEHLHAAFTAMRWVGAKFDYAMAIPFLRKQVECRAAIMRTAEWERTTQRSPEALGMARCRMGTSADPRERAEIPPVRSWHARRLRGGSGCGRVPNRAAQNPTHKQPRNQYP